MNACPRCGGWLLPECDGDQGCILCGHVVYDFTTAMVDQLAAALLKAERQREGQAKGTATKLRKRAERAAA